MKLYKIMYICILDFEATCDEEKGYGHEIIEFPSVLYKWDETGFVKISEFQEFCRPTQKPKLTEFCKKLTGIKQEWVDAGDDLLEVFKRHYQWIKDNTNNLDNTFYFVTCGHWDLLSMLPTDMRKKKVIDYPKIYRRYINIKFPFENITGEKRMGMAGMLDHLGLKLEGRHHSGIDDSKNIGRMLEELINRGWVFDDSIVSYVEYKPPKTYTRGKKDNFTNLMN